MATNPEVDAWFVGLDHPLEKVFQRVRTIIVAADARMTEVVRYGTVHFECGNDMASFVQLKDRRRVSLMFNAAGRIKGTFPHLEGATVKYLRFTSMTDVDERQVELEQLTRGWCARSRQS